MYCVGKMQSGTAHRATNVFERAKRISWLSGPDLHVVDLCLAPEIKSA